MIGQPQRLAGYDFTNCFAAKSIRGNFRVASSKAEKPRIDSNPGRSRLRLRASRRGSTADHFPLVDFENNVSVLVLTVSCHPTTARFAPQHFIAMGRTMDPDVHAAFVEFKAKDDDKCMSVQCLYCQQVRAKNTSRQKQHLQECPGLRDMGGRQSLPGPPSIPGTVGPSSSNNSSVPMRPPTNGTTTNGPTRPPGAPATPTIGNSTPTPAPTANGPVFPNGPSSGPPHSENTLRQALLDHNSTVNRAPPPQSSGFAPSLSIQQPSFQTPTQPFQQTPGSNTTPKHSRKRQKLNPTATLPAPPLDDVHAAFVEFRAKEEDKCLSVQCIYCQQVRAKNTSRQRQHLLECPNYLSAMKGQIPANNLENTFPEDAVASSVSLPKPELELDFRISVTLNTKISIGLGIWGDRNWISFIGGQWAGRWGKGTVLPGGQDAQLVVKDLATHLEAKYLLQTSDDPPAFILVKTNGWRTGPKEVLERLLDPEQADSVSPGDYKFRLTVSLETGDERYSFLNTGMWVGSGCRRGYEVIYDAYRIT
ncbi:MAG: hypothetical protein M1834_007411 [Cirrosporium novae-zelandiae]|nr:MAG: hypothetical protein M1834_007411 [Cirrosporium novae-zelandiae]